MAFQNKTPINTRIRVGDLVQVITGKNAAGLRRTAADDDDTASIQKRGKVLSVNKLKGRALVEGMRMVFKHQRRTQDQQTPHEGRVQKEASIALSNLMVVCPKCDAASRLGIREEEVMRDEKKKIRRIRVCKKCGADIRER